MVYFNEGINFISNEHFFTTSKEVGMICRFLYHYRNWNYNDWYHDMWYNFVQKIHIQFGDFYISVCFRFVLVDGG